MGVPESCRSQSLPPAHTYFLTMLMASALGASGKLERAGSSPQFSSFTAWQEGKRGKIFPFLSSLLLLLKRVRKIEIMSLAPSHHFIKIKILPDRQNVIFKILLLVRIHFCPVSRQEHFKLFPFILFFNPSSIAVHSPSDSSALHFPRNQFELDFHILKALLTKEITNKKIRKPTWLPQLW